MRLRRDRRPLKGQGSHWSYGTFRCVIFGRVAEYNVQRGGWELPSVQGPDVPGNITGELVGAVNHARMIGNPTLVVVTASAALRLITTHGYDNDLRVALVKGRPQENKDHIEVPLKVSGKTIRIRIVSSSERRTCIAVYDKNNRELATN